MTIHIITDMFAQVPTLRGLVKSAEDLEALQGFPTTTKELSFLSLAKIEYMEKVAGLTVHAEDRARVKKACSLYGISGVVGEAMSMLSTAAMEKSASEIEKRAETIATIEMMKDLSRSGQVDQLVKVARKLDENYSSNEELSSHTYLKQYTGKGYMDKQAMLNALEKRRVLTGDENFEKVAYVLKGKDFSLFTDIDKVKILDTIQGLDKTAGLNPRGLNIYEETMLSELTKSAETVSLGKGKSANVDKILDVLPALQDALGADVVKEIQSAGPGSAQAVIDSLPMDLKAIIARYV